MCVYSLPNVFKTLDSVICARFSACYFGCNCGRTRCTPQHERAGAAASYFSEIAAGLVGLTAIVEAEIRPDIWVTLVPSAKICESKSVLAQREEQSRCRIAASPWCCVWGAVLAACMSTKSLLEAPFWCVTESKRSQQRTEMDTEMEACQNTRCCSASTWTQKEDRCG